MININYVLDKNIADARIDFRFNIQRIIFILSDKQFDFINLNGISYECYDNKRELSRKYLKKYSMWYDNN